MSCDCFQSSSRWYREPTQAKSETLVFNVFFFVLKKKQYYKEINITNLPTPNPLIRTLLQRTTAGGVDHTRLCGPKPETDDDSRFLSQNTSKANAFLR